MARVAVLADLADLADSALPKPALSKDKRHQEDAVAEQHQADDGHPNALVTLPNPVDVTIWRIQADYALQAAPLDAILAKIERGDIAHKA